jgi:membrane protease YdiL (CAAX protease family)
MWGPALAGILTIAVTRGKTGIKELFRRLFHWRVSLQWYLLILFLWPVVSILGDYLYAQITHQAVRVGGNSWSQTINWLAQAPILAFWACEEIGWRGFTLPRLLSRRNALASSLIVGTIWALLDFYGVYLHPSDLDNEQ